MQFKIKKTLKQVGSTATAPMWFFITYLYLLRSEIWSKGALPGGTPVGGVASGFFRQTCKKYHNCLPHRPQIKRGCRALWAVRQAGCACGYFNLMFSSCGAGAVVEAAAGFTVTIAE